MSSTLEIGQRIKQAREEKDLTLEQLGQQLGMNKSTIQRYEAGKVSKIKLPVLESIAKVLCVNPEWLALKSDNPKIEDNNITDIGIPENIIQIPKMKKVPLIGTIACGEPILAIENIEDEVDMPENIRATYALRCKGDSMINARIFDGDIVYIRQQPDVENGEIAAVLIDGEATLKRVYKYKNRLELRPENPTFPVLNYENEELEEIQILGKAVAFTSLVK